MRADVCTRACIDVGGKRSGNNFASDVLPYVRCSRCSSSSSSCSSSSSNIGSSSNGISHKTTLDYITLHYASSGGGSGGGGEWVMEFEPSAEHRPSVVRGLQQATTAATAARVYHIKLD